MKLARSRCTLPGIGALDVLASDRGIAAIAFAGMGQDESLAPWREAGWTIRTGHTALHQRFAEECSALAAGRCRRMRTPVDHRFLPPVLRSILDELRKVPAGDTVTYGELAARAGHPRAARAAGLAMRRNPTPVLVPCHRVVASNGLGGFTPGLDLKRKLLALEQPRAQPPTRR